MVLLFLLDIITSTALYITIKCGTWIVYGTANGVYYVYKKIKPSAPTNDENVDSIPLIRIDKIERNDDDATKTNDDDYDDCVILKRDEYEKLISNNMLHVKIE
jgi:hypothetical protein